MKSITDTVENNDYKSLQTKLVVRFRPMIKNFFPTSNIEPLQAFEYNLFTLSFLLFYLRNTDYKYFDDFANYVLADLTWKAEEFEKDIKNGSIQIANYDFTITRDIEYFKNKIIEFQKDILGHSNNSDTYLPRYTYASIFISPNVTAQQILEEHHLIDIPSWFNKIYYRFNALLYYSCTDQDKWYTLSKAPFESL